jgi:hypothetical protein
VDDRKDLITCFLLGFAAPVAAVSAAVLVPMTLPADVRGRWVVGLVAIVALALLAPFTKTAVALVIAWGRAQWRRRHPTETEYGVALPRCGGCGYDLRSSPDVCPECGTPVDRIDATIIRYLMSLRRRDEILRTSGK